MNGKFQLCIRISMQLTLQELLKFIAHFKALPSGEGAPEGGGRGAVQCAVIWEYFGEIILPAHFFRHAFGMPPSPKGKALFAR